MAAQRDIERLLVAWQELGMAETDLDEIRTFLSLKIDKLERAKGVEPGMLTVPDMPRAIERLGRAETQRRRASSQSMKAVHIPLEVDPDGESEDD